jgi:cell division ATPase FtsA
VASINLFKNNALQFTREMSVAGDSFTKCLTGTIVGDNFQLNLNLAQAEALKIRFGIPKEDATDQTDEGISLTQIRAALRPTLRRFSNEIQRSFDYYKEQFLEEKISKIYLSGGSSKLKNLDAFICESFAVPVEVLNPFQRIGLSTALKHKEAELAEIAPRLTLALGLAIGRAQSLNLIKEEKKKKPKTPATPSLNLTELKSKIKLGELAKIFENLPYTNFISGGLVILLLLCALGYNFYLSNRIAYYSKELASRKLALTDLKALISRRTIIKKISAEETKVRETLGKLASTLPSSITLSSLNYQNTTRTALITGTCSNIQKIGDIINAIESSPNFSEVQLKSAKKISDSEKMKIILRYRFTLIRNKQ